MMRTILLVTVCCLVIVQCQDAPPSSSGDHQSSGMSGSGSSPPPSSGDHQSSGMSGSGSAPPTPPPSSSGDHHSSGMAPPSSSGDHRSSSGMSGSGSAPPPSSGGDHHSSSGMSGGSAPPPSSSGAGGCSVDQMRECANRPKLSDCDKGQQPEKKDCCDTCKPAPAPFCPPASDLRKCNKDEAPERNDATGCFSCRGPRPCTKEDVEKVEAGYAALPECPIGVVAERLEDCSMSCRAPAKPRCSATAADQCQTKLAGTSIAECTAGAVPTFSEETCCYTCRRPAAPAPQNKAKCNVTEIAACRAISPICGTDETPIFDEKFCCPSCTRPELLCTKEDVVNCLAAAPVCAEGVRPVYAASECCPSCSKPLPSKAKCNNCAGEEQVCMELTSGGYQCTDLAVMKLEFKPESADGVAQLQAWGNSSSIWTNFVREFIGRHCDRKDALSNCTAFAPNIAQVRCKAENVNGTARVLVGFPDHKDNNSSRPSFTPSRRLLATSTSASIQSQLTDFVLAASNDELAADGFSVEVFAEETESSTATSQSSSSSSSTGTSSSTGSITSNAQAIGGSVATMVFLGLLALTRF